LACGLNRLVLPEETPLTLGGGEPTLYPDFYELIRKLTLPVDILTNGTFNINEFVEKIKPEKIFKSKNPSYKSIRFSYHPKFMSQDFLLEKAKTLQDRGFNVGIFSINHPDNLTSNMEIAEKARKEQIYFFIKDFLDGKNFGYYKYQDAVSKINKLPRSVSCRTKDLLISPDGFIYRCHRDLYRAENPISDLLYPRLKIEYTFRQCNNFGFCNPCDVKQKTNRFLQMGNCSVEIKK
jgi:hypothetical protein